MAENIEELLKDRGGDYGDFKMQVNTIMDILNLLRRLRYDAAGDLPRTVIQEMDVYNFFLVLKLCRLNTSGSERAVIDSAVDLQGYARLIEKEFDKILNESNSTLGGV